MNDLQALEIQAEIALQKLGVAEELGWGIAALSAMVVYLKWGGWLWPAVAFIASYFLVTLRYRRSETAAADAYERASGTGKHFKPENNK